MRMSWSEGSNSLGASYLKTEAEPVYEPQCFSVYIYIYIYVCYIMDEVKMEKILHVNNMWKESLCIQ
jgi:hypothetical protein